MTKRSPLKVGDRCRVYDNASFSYPVTGEIFQDTSTTCDVKLDRGGNWSGFKKQCRRLIKRPRKEKQERVQFWADVTRSGKSYDLLEEPPGDEPLALPGNRWVHLVELRPGEVITDRKHVADVLLISTCGRNIPIGDREKIYAEVLKRLNLPEFP